MLLIINNSIFV